MNGDHGAPISPTVTVVIPAHDGERFLERAIASALAQEGVDLELIVRDDGSRDRSFDVARRAVGSDPRGRVDRTTENLGIARTVNGAVRSARGAWLLILHQDCELLDRDAFRKTLPVDPAASAEWFVGTPILQPNRLSAAERWFWIIRNHLYSTTLGGVRTGRLDLFSENKCDLIRKETFERLGGFDESIVGGGEDQVLAARARRRGVLPATAPELRFGISLGSARTVRTNLRKEFHYGNQVKQVVRRAGAGYASGGAGASRDARWRNRVAGIGWILATATLLAAFGLIDPRLLPLAAAPAVVRAAMLEFRGLRVRGAYQLRSSDLAALPLAGVLADLWYFAGLITPLRAPRGGTGARSPADLGLSPVSRSPP
jgi:GT2 family glycosyltransferase